MSPLSSPRLQARRKSRGDSGRSSTAGLMMATSSSSMLNASASESEQASDNNRRRPADEIWLSDLLATRPIGEGAFGQVFEAVWQGTTKVAMKRLVRQTDGTEIGSDGGGAASASEAFAAEASVLKQMRHPNVVLFLGLFEDKDAQRWIVTEYVSKGSLSSLLQSEEGSRIGVVALHQLAKNCAAGMAYLSQNHILHRDLSARNVLVKTEGSLYVAKVADFGLSRVADHYVSTSTRFPVKWTAPEALQYRRFSSKSDVWSFGVLLWEMFEYGKTPFGEMTNREAMDFVLKGSRLCCPELCPEAVYELMVECWSEQPGNRPSFKQCYDVLASSLLRVSSSSLTTAAVAAASSSSSTTLTGQVSGYHHPPTALDPTASPFVPSPGGLAEPPARSADLAAAQAAGALHNMGYYYGSEIGLGSEPDVSTSTLKSPRPDEETND